MHDSHPIRTKLGSAGIKAIKLHAWEAPFEKRINHLREVEMQQIRRALPCLVYRDDVVLDGYMLLDITVQLRTCTGWRCAQT